MVKADIKIKPYQCEECGLHYFDADLAAKCQSWCSAHGSCNLEITRQAIERQGPEEK